MQGALNERFESTAVYLGERHALCAHSACTLHLFYLDNLLDAIVCRTAVRSRVAELVPYFTLHALRTALYMLSLGQ